VLLQRSRAGSVIRAVAFGPAFASLFGLCACLGFAVWLGCALWLCCLAGVRAFCASASPRSLIFCNGFGGLSRRERCLDKPPKPLKAARIGVRQKEWMTRICREFGLSPLGAWGAAGWQPALVRPAAGGVVVSRAASVGSLRWFVRRPAFWGWLRRSRSCVYSRSSSGQRAVWSRRSQSCACPVSSSGSHRGFGWLYEQTQHREPPDSPRSGRQPVRLDQVPNGTCRTNGSRLPTDATRPTTNRNPPDERERLLTGATRPEAAERTRAGSQPRRPLSFRGTERRPRGIAS
jgi:hypothetical protein